MMSTFLYKKTICSVCRNSNPGQFGDILPTYTAYEDETECSETSAYTIQMPGNHPKESIQPFSFRFTASYFPLNDQPCVLFISVVTSCTLSYVGVRFLISYLS
jgi:hypothetical protein